MKNTIKNISTFMFIVSIGILSTTVYSGEFVNVEAEGNLESKYTVGCMPLSELTNKHTPADIYPGFSKCAEEGNLEYGARLFFLAGTYGRFDILRVTDKSAHQAVRALLLINFRKVNEDKISAFMKNIKIKMLENDSAEKNKICDEIKQFGSPDYYPRYMVQHGMKALEPDNSNSIKDDFDTEEAWDASLKGYMRCN